MNNIKILVVAGARPNFVKISPLIEELDNQENIEAKIVHTGQHYDAKLSDAFFNDLNIRKPDIYLGVNTGSHAEQTSSIHLKFNKVLENENPDLVIVVGDVNSTLACSLAAAKRHIKVAHIEAGLRSFNKQMPEELNRILTDNLSNFLFISEKSAEKNLKKEGIEDNVYFVGNIMIDTLKKNFPKIENNTKILEKLELIPKNYILLTAHRPENVDKKENLEKILKIIEEISKTYKIVLPIHPRTLKNIEELKLQSHLDSENIKQLPPLGYIDFNTLQKNAFAIITDSGGIQEESTFLQVPCLTIRNETERPSTIDVGTNKIVPLNLQTIKKELDEIKSGKYKKGSIPELWDGQTAKRITDIIVDKCNFQKR